MGDPRGGPGRVAGPSEFRDRSQDPRRSGTARWTLRKVRSGVEGPAGKSRMVLRTLGEDLDGSGDLRGRPGRFGGPSGKSRTVGGTLGEVRDGSGDPRGVRDKSWDPCEVQDGLKESRQGPGRVGGPSERSGTGWGTLGEVRDGSSYPCGGPGRVGRSSGRYGTVWGTLGEVCDGSEDPQGGLG